MTTDFDYSKIDNYEELRKLQLTQVEILKDIDEFCVANNIPYSIAFGTVLGAVRHGGFIPWDDDVDICMLREDYNRFISLWKDNDKYLLQNHSTNPDFTQTFTKIRKRNTAFVQTTDVGKDFHKGIFVDIFPFDRVAEGGVKRKIQILNSVLYALYSRGYTPKNNGTLMRLCSSIILKLKPKSKYDAAAQKQLKKLTKYNHNKKLKIYSVSTFGNMKKEYDSDLFENLSRIKYENITVSVFNKYDQFLSYFYGDYMKLPPVSERNWTHRPIKIDFEHEYKEQ